MATYVIGDLQGCLDPLLALLEKIAYKPQHDQLWFAGDLVNRGPQSLACLSFVKALQPAPIVVLGNHDLHLLAVAEGYATSNDDDTLDDILQSPQRDELLHWLRQQPLLHYDATWQQVLVHAGLPPEWDLSLAQQCAQALENVLRSDQYKDFLKHMYGNQPNRWQSDLQSWDRLRFICNALTRLRFCNQQGELDFSYKGKVGKQNAGYLPWFEIPNRQCEKLNIIFGHWAALKGETHNHLYHAIDTGCVWGRRLTALRLEDKQRFSVPGLT